MTQYVAVGDVLGHTQTYRSGPGTVVRGTDICATQFGSVSIGDNALSVVRTRRPAHGHHLAQTERAATLPLVGSIVLARITRTNRLQASCQIIAIGDSPLFDDFQGVIRAADVRATEKDKVKIASSFRPGDIVRAEVISLGDQQNYFLSTADNRCGVLFAWNELGSLMYPQDWRTMSSEDGTQEERKVAKPFV